VDGGGNVMVQEDPGNSAYIAKTWRMNPQTRTAVQVLESDRARFITGAPQFLTQDEENSGVIDVTDYVKQARWARADRRYYLGVTQAHYTIVGELVEGGQLYLLSGPR
jgi:hypothetical protein